MAKRCKSSFAASVRGVPRVMKVGSLVNDDDPVLKGREHLFEDVDTYVQERAARVEDASAAPGRRRGLTRPVKKAAAKQEPRQSEQQAAGGKQEGTAS